MGSIEYYGQWWLPEKPENKVSGKLNFECGKSPTLSLDGIFGNVYEAKYLLGHKSILSTQRYTQDIEFQGDEYYSAEVKTKEEAKQLIEAGYSYVTDVDGVKLFKKPK